MEDMFQIRTAGEQAFNRDYLWDAYSREEWIGYTQKEDYRAGQRYRLTQKSIKHAETMSEYQLVLVCVYGTACVHVPPFTETKQHNWW